MDIFFCLVFVMSLCVSVYLCLVVTCWERADLFAVVCGDCITVSLSLSQLYRFLIVAPLLTSILA